MPESLFQNIKLRSAYGINSFIYWLRKIPVLRDIVPDDPYAKGWLKKLGPVISALLSAVKFFAIKLLYFFVLVFPAAAMFSDGGAREPERAFIHVFIFLSLTGAFINSRWMTSDLNSYYAVFLMRMDARDYSLSELVLEYIRTFFGDLPVLLILRRFIYSREGIYVPFWILILMSLLPSALKTSVSLLKILYFRKKGRIPDLAKDPALMTPLLLLSLAAAYVLPAFGIMLSVGASAAVMAASIVLAAVSMYFLCRADEYRDILRADQYSTLFPDTVQQKLQTNYQNEIVLEQEQFPGLEGCRYLNAVFVSRHRKMLWQRSKIISIVVACLMAGVLLSCAMLSNVREFANERLSAIAVPLLYVMYLINTGQNLTQIMFYNCDHSLLSYRFYRRPDVILSLFSERLKTCILVNLLPASVIAAGIPLALLLSGGTDRPYEYLLLPAAVLCMSAFFSVHYLVLYYLLQPYNAALEMKDPAYRIIAGVTYAVCYYAGQISHVTTPLLFTLIIIAFCIIYIPVSLVLVYRYAPQSFRIRT
ncbi:MAG: hypothetical protein IK029_05375 [Oscillospiraceae bacterium]|nr:hypothetical protein [Oscillospiraceae bacterium]